MNSADSEFYASILTECGFTQTDADNADLVFINTCAVRETSVHKLESRLGELFKRKRLTGMPRIGVVGCVPAIDLEVFKKKHKEVDFVLGTYPDRKSMELALVEALGIALDHPIALKTSAVTAYVPITTGCDSFCTYCIVPYTRGRLVSRKPEEIIEECKQLITNGTREIVLLGQNVNVFGQDFNNKFGFADLLSSIDELDNLKRVRFITSHPKDMDETTLLKLRQLKKLAWYFHLPIQAGSDEVLCRMNRRYTIGQYKSLIEKIRNIFPVSGITSDIIVGFPGETNEQFEETMDVVNQIRFDQVYMAMYSKRPKTPAAQFHQQVDRDELHRRISRLLDVQRAISIEVSQEYVARTCKVFIESNNEDKSVGLTETGKLTFIQQVLKPGEIYNVKITRSSLSSLHGEIAE
jgi:tRNA-2-methylthio-N6-dimethylallyladenosine synthase